MRTSMGGLDCTVFPESEGPPLGAVVLCHGFGAPGDDLCGLYPELLELRPGLKRVRFVFPEAPLSLGASMGIAGRAWWLVDFVRAQRMQSAGPDALLEFRKAEPEGMGHARALLRGLVDALATQSGLGVGQIVLGGFSQGAMVSTDVALRLEEAPAGLAALSGTLLLEDLWRQRARARSGLRVFQSHGRQDPLLPFWVAERLKDLFVEAGHRHTFMPFEGGHEIPIAVLRGLAGFLGEALAV